MILPKWLFEDIREKEFVRGYETSLGRIKYIFKTDFKKDHIYSYDEIRDWLEDITK